MSSVTPNAVRHSGLPPLASRFVEVSVLPCEKKDGRETDQTGRDWNEAWGKTLFG